MQSPEFWHILTAYCIFSSVFYYFVYSNTQYYILEDDGTDINTIEEDIVNLIQEVTHAFGNLCQNWHNFTLEEECDISDACGVHQNLQYLTKSIAEYPNPQEIMVEIQNTYDQHFNSGYQCINNARTMKRENERERTVLKFYFILPTSLHNTNILANDSPKIQLLKESFTQFSEFLRRSLLCIDMNPKEKNWKPNLTGLELNTKIGAMQGLEDLKNRIDIFRQKTSLLKELLILQNVLVKLNSFLCVSVIAQQIKICNNVYKMFPIFCIVNILILYIFCHFPIIPFYLVFRMHIFTIIVYDKYFIRAADIKKKFWTFALIDSAKHQPVKFLKHRSYKNKKQRKKMKKHCK